jgi:type IV pilus assembly protein PilE
LGANKGGAVTQGNPYRPHTARASRGFTLIELMIVVAIMAIIASVAIPSYRNYNMKANRSSAAQVMLNISNREEQYLLDARAYTDILGTSGLNITAEGWTCTNSAATGCSNNFYTVTVAVTAGTPPTYIVTGAPKSATYQVSDGTLTLNSAGVKSRSAGDGKW